MPTYVYPFFQDGSGIYRPFIPIKIINPATGDSIIVRALIDTGADDCVFPKFIPDKINHELKADGIDVHVSQGLGKEKCELWKHPCRIELLDPQNYKNTVWRSGILLIGCADHDSIPPLLGFNGFISNFRITFNYPTKRIIIEIPSK